MIGIVLVSHSAKLAEGVLDLAREMAGTTVAIEACGGLDLPEKPLGTDPAFIANTIQRMFAGKNTEFEVLVLMDLGSVILSAEMAIHLLPYE